MTVSVDFIFDFGSPNAYFCHRLLADMEKRTGATFNYVPCLLGGIFKATGNQAPMMAYAKVKGKNDYERIEIMRFIKRHQLNDFRFNRNFPVNTLLMMRGAVASEMDGNLARYVEAGMAAMWENDQKMDDPDTFVAVMNEAGLDGASLLERSKDPQIKAKLVANTEAAVARKTFGIPTFYVGDEMFFGKERLGQLEEEVLSQMAAVKVS
ncbi:2-hydroxychromene-2-carboxylate isomerase [Pseudovibrio axinellae]|uniref:2-hydroxychromene-2-carboxylate isomerase n=1 Tax=Pseudovibrio axinellae TaxID=989403 RepID=A0A165VTV7_9HYPH|nr:2-hydroxychromene-2-carboxylate isomerase [Pseudovibrio axinellae]KZL15435.1 2-hydroxychromene-2-carboxylate isomerase [Pseudovibrio axinellae]SER56362.1 2-hydroxychromene-2-carboxylate isomerase [Pseudovibrio axinellae]